MNDMDIRWEQRFSNFNKALHKLESSVTYIKRNHESNEIIEEQEGNYSILNDLIKQGLIQSFEFTHELAWNVMKDYAAYQGNAEIRGSRDATREGFSMGLIENGDVWMEMVKSRNETSHTYDEDTASEIFEKVIYTYMPAFKSFQKKMEAIRSEEQGKLFY